MSFFVVFNTNGLILHQKGTMPTFASDLIKQINISNISGRKRIRDSIMEYEIHGNIVYLCITNKEESLEKYIKEYKISCNNKKNVSEDSNKNVNNLNFSDINNTSNNTNDIKSTIQQIENIGLKSKSFLKSSFSKIFYNKIEINKLKEIMNDFLIKKNIDLKYVKIIADSVVDELKEKEYVTELEFKNKMGEILEKILPSVNHRDLLEKIKNSNKNFKKPFTILFVGVNGVGKSTSLAKVACYLLRNNLKVFIAACDTFRAGAIEQLKVHVDRFSTAGHKVGFYEGGYKKDDANVCKSAIMTASAIANQYDVILIDTAGRMHNKSALMASLSKLVRINNPDYIVFVGEALVGGDSLNHIKEFNKSIDEGIPGRSIDSIILTKVDTVSSKIGQIINLTFSSSAPVLFIGTGQGNTDLHPIDPKNIAEIISGIE